MDQISRRNRGSSGRAKLPGDARVCSLEAKRVLENDSCEFGKIARANGQYLESEYLVTYPVAGAAATARWINVYPSNGALNQKKK